MDDLNKALAPISQKAWQEIEDEAKRTLQASLSARRVVDFVGPLGWPTSAIPLGRVRELEELDSKVKSSLRTVQPLIELKVEFELARTELDAIARGAKDGDLDPLRTAARSIAMAEDRIVFNGYPAGAISGICDIEQSAKLQLTTNYAEYPAVVADALSILRKEGVAGPYAIALGPRCYTGLTKTTQGGYPVLEHVTRLIGGPVVWAPAVDGAVVVSLRGGDFELTVGRDLSIGYSHHTSKTVTLYFQESLTSRVTGPEAAVVLKYS